MNPVVVFGGYGVFGRHVARELAGYGLPVTVAGRDGNRASAMARELGTNHRSVAVDVTDPRECRSVLAGASVAVHCAGPFRAGETGVLDACLVVGCHYVDITDDRAYAVRVREYSSRFGDRGRAAVYGGSSLPGVSGALALRAATGRSEPPARARVTLFIGNDNPKGRAAVASLVAGLGRRIAAPQGILRGFRDRAVVPLPAPFGRRPVFNFDSPDYDLLPGAVRVRSVAVKVGFELRTTTYAFALLARLPFRYGRRTSRLLNVAATILPRVGSSGGAVMVELFFADGSARRTAVVARSDGQRMAALPCAYAARALATGGTSFRGSGTVSELLGADSLLAQLTADGFELHEESA